MGNWEVDADHDKNRLYITLEGFLDDEESEASSSAVIEAAQSMDEGFDVITDISTAQPGTADAVEHIQRGKEAVAENGASAAVRIAPESTTGKMQFERAGDAAYPVAMAESVEDAEALLDQRRDDEG